MDVSLPIVPSDCFRGDTLVATEAGLRPIRDIGLGERVWSWDEDSGRKVLRKVSRTYRKPASRLRVLRVGQETLYTTDDHPYWVEGQGWTEAWKLRVGDRLRTDEGSLLALQANDRVDAARFYAGYDLAPDRAALASLDEPVRVRLVGFRPSEVVTEAVVGAVYNLEVEDTHTFFVGKQQVLVHNK